MPSQGGVNRQSAAQNVADGHNVQGARQNPAPNVSRFDMEVKVSPMKYDGNTDLESYLSQFEGVATLHGWTLEQMSTILMSRLKGKALEAADLRVNHTYSDIVRALRKRFSPELEAIWHTKNEELAAC